MSELSNLTADNLVTAFVTRLRQRREDVACVASFSNSFEGWLKYELALELCHPPWSRRPTAGPMGDETIGVEYKAKTATEGPTRGWKQVDLWVSSIEAAKWHAVELKVVFDNQNQGKQVSSWRSDLEAMRAITAEREPGIDQRIALLVAVGIDRNRLADAAHGALCHPICEEPLVTVVSLHA